MNPVLAIDIGTSSCRAALFDEAARRIDGTTAQQSCRLITGKDGRAEIDPRQLLRVVTLCIRETLATLPEGARVEAVGVSCFWHSLVGVAANGNPVTPVITWADSRNRADAEKLRRDLDEREAHAITGCMLRASFWPAKLAWLRRTNRDLFREVECWLSPAEWLQLQLCGETSCAAGMATGTGLYSPLTLDWSPEMLDVLKLKPASLPILSDAPAICGKRAAKIHPALAGAKWFPAIGDGAASNLGAGASRPGYAALNFGTSAAIRVMKSRGKPQAPFGLFCYRVDAERYLIGGAVSNAGNLRAWALRELSLDDTAIDAVLAQREPGRHGLTVLPFLTAERAPTWPEDLRGAVLGLTQATTSLDLYEALMESTFQRLAWIADSIPGNAQTQILVSGGLQRSATMMQRLSDVMGRALNPNDEAEASLRGAAVLALEQSGCEIPPNPTRSPVRPRGKFTAHFREARKKMIRLETALREIEAV